MPYGYSLLLQCYQSGHDPYFLQIPFALAGECQRCIDRGKEPLLEYGKQISEYLRRSRKDRKSQEDSVRLYRLEVVNASRMKASKTGREYSTQRLPQDAIESILLARKAGLSLKKTAAKLGLAVSTVSRYQASLRAEGRL